MEHSKEDIFLNLLNKPQDFFVSSIAISHFSKLIAPKKNLLRDFWLGDFPEDSLKKITAILPATPSFDINNFESLLSQSLAHFERCYSYQEKSLKLKTELIHLLDALKTRKQITIPRIEKRVKVDQELLGDYATKDLPSFQSFHTNSGTKDYPMGKNLEAIAQNLKSSLYWMMLKDRHHSDSGIQNRYDSYISRSSSFSNNLKFYRNVYKEKALAKKDEDLLQKEKSIIEEIEMAFLQGGELDFISRIETLNEYINNEIKHGFEKYFCATSGLKAIFPSPFNGFFPTINPENVTSDYLKTLIIQCKNLIHELDKFLKSYKTITVRKPLVELVAADSQFTINNILPKGFHPGSKVMSLSLICDDLKHTSSQFLITPSDKSFKPSKLILSPTTKEVIYSDESMRYCPLDSHWKITPLTEPNIPKNVYCQAVILVNKKYL